MDGSKIKCWLELSCQEKLSFLEMVTQAMTEDFIPVETASLKESCQHRAIASLNDWPPPVFIHEAKLGTICFGD